MYVYRIGTDGASPVRFKHERRKREVKKNWKKVLLTITAVLVAAGLAGCGKGNATGNTAGQTEQQAESTKEQKNQSQTEDTGKKDSVIEMCIRDRHMTVLCLGTGKDQTVADVQVGVQYDG